MSNDICKGPPNRPDKPDSPVFERLILGVDWGGGIDGVSVTAMALLGMAPDGRIDVLWGKRFVSSKDHIGEAKECLYWMRTFGVDWVAHDYTGAGELRESFLVQAGVPLNKLLSIKYIGPAKHNIVNHTGATQDQPRGYYSVDRSRLLLYTIGGIKSGFIRFFRYDGEAGTSTGLLSDFLALYEEKSDSYGGRELYKICRRSGKTDDFAQAVTIGCAMLWHVTGRWPNFAIPDNTLIDELYN